jgi:hypothetical protein
MHRTHLRPGFKPDRHADQLVNEARRRYNQLTITSRPGPQPPNIACLFTPVELLRLSLAGRWPLPAADLAWVTGRQPGPDSADQVRTGRGVP